MKTNPQSRQGSTAADTMCATNRYRKAHTGGAIISALAFTAVTSMMLVGMLTVSTSYFTRANSEADYDLALAVAEAGVNYEFRKISTNVNSADQVSAGKPNGMTFPLGSGTFTVSCTNKDGSTPWTAPGDLYVVSIGTVHGISRTVKVSAKGYGATTPTYAVYAVNNGGLSDGAEITGAVGTDGHLQTTACADVNGSVEFDGPGTGWTGSNVTGSPITFKSNPVVWPTVSAIALQQFPSGGLTWLATHNDNSLSRDISNNKLTPSGCGDATLVGKPGGANYYLTDVDLNDMSTVTFENSAGPITIWMGPVNGTGKSTFSGGNSTVKNDPSRAVRIYSAMKTPFTLVGNSTFYAGVYAYDVSNGVAIGTFTDAGGTKIQGTVLANAVTVGGGSRVNSTFTYFNSNSSGATYYGYDNSWTEVNPM